MTGLAMLRARAESYLSENAGRFHLPMFGDMSKRDAERWAACRTIGDLGETVIAWLNGRVTQTPGHGGCPCDETLPLRPALTVINRGGFITDNSQLAETLEGDTWNTWVSGFASDATLARLREAIDGTPLTLGACRRRVHGCRRRGFRRCPWRECVSFWADCCPQVADELWDCWFVHIEDPKPGRNDLLWPTLTNALKGNR